MNEKSELLVCQFCGARTIKNGAKVVKTTTSLPYTHLIYLRRYSIFTNNYELKVLGVNTKDIFHAMGEIIFRSETHIKRIDFAECTQSRLDYWEKEGFSINEFREKYT